MRYNIIRRLFEHDQLCIKCGYWYTPEILSDDEGVCPSCRKLTTTALKRSNFTMNTVKVVYEQMRLHYEDNREPPYVYFMLARQTRKVKVGFTGGNPYFRLRELQTGSPDLLELRGVISEPFEFERIMHEALKPYHSHGEWFDGFMDLMTWIKRVGFLPSDE